MKQYEYAIEYRYEHEDSIGFAEWMASPSYEDAMRTAKYFHEDGAKEVAIIRREVSDWKPIHQSGLPEGTTKGEINE